MRKHAAPTLLVLLVLALVAFLVQRTDDDDGGASARGDRRGHARERPAHASPAPGLGISYGDDLALLSARRQDEALRDATRLRAGWVRLDVSWPGVQAAGPGSYDWRRVDREIGQARRHGLRVLGVLGYTPPWARDTGCHRFTCPPSDPARFARFARAAARRYRGRVSAWEVWNEPNSTRFWVRPDPVRYGRLLALAVPALSAADPRADVVFGGLATADAAPDRLETGQFLLAACAGPAATACRHLDGLGYHPFTFTADRPHLADSPAWLRIDHGAGVAPSLRQAMRRVGIEHLWLTIGGPTGGRPTAGPDSGLHLSEAGQAAAVRHGMREAYAHAGLVEAVFVFTGRDRAGSGSNQDYFGLRRRDGSPKPAWAAFRDAVR